MTRKRPFNYCWYAVGVCCQMADCFCFLFKNTPFWFSRNLKFDFLIHSGLLYHAPVFGLLLPPHSSARSLAGHSHYYPYLHQFCRAIQLAKAAGSTCSGEADQQDQIWYKKKAGPGSWAWGVLSSLQLWRYVSCFWKCESNFLFSHVQHCFLPLWTKILILPSAYGQTAMLVGPFLQVF